MPVSLARWFWKNSAMKSILPIVAFTYALLSVAQGSPPDGFSYVKDSIPNIVLEMRYCGDDNFIGQPIEGYNEPVCILSNEAIAALEQVQHELNGKGYGLKIFDAYRPQPAVDQFVRWAKKLEDTLMKRRYYPEVKKQHLFKEGYISSKSGHSRGSTVDLTLVYLEGERKGEEVDMGSPYDFFGKISWPKSDLVTEEQFKNRMLLREAMLKHGFKPLYTEWWHFTLRNEPYPNTYFDFEVE